MNPAPPVTSTRHGFNPDPPPNPMNRQDTDLYDPGQQNISSWMLSGSRNTSTPP